MKYIDHFVSTLLCGIAVCSIAAAQCTQLPSGEWRCTPDKPTAEPTAMDVRIECPTARGSGTSVARATDGGTLIVTNHHVVQSQSSIVVRTTGGASAARVVATDTANDLALLHVSVRWPFVNLGEAIRVGGAVQFRAFDSGVKFRKYYGTITDEYRAAGGGSGYFATGQSVPGNSGGGVYSRGMLVGVVWGAPNGGTALVPVGPLRRLIAGLHTRHTTPPTPPTFPSSPPATTPSNCPPPCDCQERWARLEQRLEALTPAQRNPEPGNQARRLPTPDIPVHDRRTTQSDAVNWLQVAAAAAGVSGPIGVAIVAAGLLIRIRSARSERGLGGPRSGDFRHQPVGSPERHTGE